MTRPVLSEMSAAVQAEVAATRERVARLHAELVRYELVIWTAGNVSERVRSDEVELFVIKPSGVSYDELTPESMVVCTLDGTKIVDGTPDRLTPSSDTAAHAYVYRHMSEVGGVVHTHSTYATAWAARNEPVPCVITMMGDEFGGEIPVGPFALIGDDSIGQGIVETLRNSRSRAVLMANHGPFTIGADAKDAVKAAVMCEDVARTVHIAKQLGDVVPIAPEHIDALFDRYQNVYGQRAEDGKD
ncbi:L-ribulose-5-phosphate 4-epimerase [Ruania alba]|uniref:L-ribulose-5-phosphate 4-epimerase n=1 Tax=Ruania alba TaxID=648782 RepID=A0A1H5BDI8_9MICO|nr:L-ribulose-5-phosphate 4-epimerase [Ruania alba]SED52114.1 L-ribulose 5-phosphate 4-epimerase [Ruania alba]